MRTILIALDSETEADRLWARAQLTNLASRLDEINAKQERTGSPDPDEPIALDPPPSCTPTKLERKRKVYSSPDDYRKKTGRRFRTTAAQVKRGLSREEAFAEWQGHIVEVSR